VTRESIVVYIIEIWETRISRGPMYTILISGVTTSNRQRVRMVPGPVRLGDPMINFSGSVKNIRNWHENYTKYARLVLFLFRPADY